MVPTHKDLDDRRLILNVARFIELGFWNRYLPLSTRWTSFLGNNLLTTDFSLKAGDTEWRLILVDRNTRQVEDVELLAIVGSVADGADVWLLGSFAG